MLSQDRIYSVDILRGIVIVLMALGHSRHFFLIYDFAPTNLAFTFPALFFTRWITNLCAPVFVYLAGVSIYLVQVRKDDPKSISMLLVKRGIWLIFLEMTILTFFWHTHFDEIQLQVIWIIGVAFLFMSILIYLPRNILLVLSVLIIILHNLLDSMDPSNLSDTWRIAFIFLHHPGDILIGNTIRVNVLYSFLPYIGMMLLGYSMGGLYKADQGSRRRILILVGSSMIVAFIILRGLNFYGDPELWEVQEKGGIFTVMSFLNVTKYPPSLLFLLSTLGPAFILLPMLEDKMNYRWAESLAHLGQVAMFFYLIHIPFVRVCAKVYQLIFHNNPGTIVFYLIWLAMVAVLYKTSMIYREYKMSRKYNPRYWWLRYI